MKILNEIVDNEMYVSPDGTRMCRECGTSENTFQRQWVLRDPIGQYVDRDRFRNDLAERHDLKLVSLLAQNDQIKS